MLYRLLYIAFIASLPLTSVAQQWVDIGVKGGYGVNFWYNQDFLDNGDMNNRMRGGYTFGGKLGFNFSLRSELTIDVGVSQFNQGFAYDVAISNYEKEIQLNTTDFMLLYRLNSEGRYFEIGPQYSLLKSATETDANPDMAGGNISDMLADNYTGIVLGFGSYMMGTDNFGVILGFRIRYGISDLLSEDGRSMNYPATLVSNSNPSASHPLTAEAVLELNFDLGYLAKANCGQRKKILFF